MNKIKVIIADDHQLVIDGIKSLLFEAKEIEVVGEAHNGKQAVEMAKKKILTLS